VKETSARCYLCGLTVDQLESIGRGLQAHHVVPFAAAGDEGPQIPLCTLCHEIARALQHAAGRQFS
jgi:predicted HNH restriction endonuclease